MLRQRAALLCPPPPNLPNGETQSLRSDPTRNEYKIKDRIE